MNIITVTLNPAIDAHFRCDSLKPHEDNPYILEGRDSGGKGVNVSRALYTNGINNLCYVMVGYITLCIGVRYNLIICIITVNFACEKVFYYISGNIALILCFYTHRIRYGRSSSISIVTVFGYCT